jgi:hypothetical protein
MTKTLTAALLGAATLVVLSLPVNAASSTTVTDTPRVAAPSMQLAQAARPYDPSAGSVGFKAKKKATKKGKKKSKK